MVLKSVDDYRINENKQLTVNLAAIADTKAIGQILAKSFYSLPEFASWIYPFLQFTISEDIRHRLRSQSPHYCCFIARLPRQNNQITLVDRFSSQQNSNSIIVGTIEIALKSPSLWSNAAQFPYISNLAVHEHYRRSGIGNQLLAKCEELALKWGYSETRLHVLDSNDAAKQLYCNNGYQISQIEANWNHLWFGYSPRLFLKKQI